MASYRLSRAAEHDLDSIFDYGVSQFGLDQTIRYQEGLEAHLVSLTDRPRLYRAVDFISAGLRRSIYRSHAVYYRVEDRGVLVVRILGQQDVGGALEGQ